MAGFMRKAACNFLCAGSRSLSVSAPRNAKVAVLGAAGGIGQPLSLLLKQSTLISELALYDVANTVGVAADLSHIESKAQVKGYVGESQLEECLAGSQVVIMPAGVPRKPGMTRDDLFKINAGIAKSLSEAASTVCPEAMLCIISNPVNSTVPIASEVYKKNNNFDPRKLFGVTTLDVVRANTFISELKSTPVNQTQCPVIGGHAGATILPLLSQVEPSCEFTDEERAALTVRIQNAGTEVVEAKAGGGSATLSMAYAGARFAFALLQAMNGAKNVIECSFVESDVTDLQFFSTPLRLGPSGVEENLGLGTLIDFEQEALEKMKPELKGSIEKGIKFANE